MNTLIQIKQDRQQRKARRRLRVAAGADAVGTVVLRLTRAAEKARVAVGAGAVGAAEALAAPRAARRSGDARCMTAVRRAARSGAFRKFIASTCENQLI